MRTSAAVQMRDLAQEFLRQGHEPTVIVPGVDLAGAWALDVADGVQVLRLPGLRTRDTAYVRRALSEFVLPFVMMRSLRKSPLSRTPWRLAVWYSPTIFFGPLIWVLRRACNCRTYLILRDIFPEWALDLGLMRKGLAYAFFKGVAAFQYAMADTIGVQTPSNLAYLAGWAGRPGRRLEVLRNWQYRVHNAGSSIVVDHTPIRGRKIFVYIGNMGVAQGMDILIELAERLKHRRDIGFLFVGRGSEVPRLKASLAERSMTNTLFFDEIDSSEMGGLLAQCHVGLLALDPRHRTHNIPGKFVTYLLAGLPVLARVNPGTDLAHLIEEEGIGRVHTGESADPLQASALELADSAPLRQAMSDRARALGERMFSPAVAVSQIVATVSEHAS